MTGKFIRESKAGARPASSRAAQRPAASLPGANPLVGPEGVLTAADHLLEQCASLVDRLRDETYAADSRVIPGGTVGKHIRHVLDHYEAIILATETGGVVMYDRRERNVPMETRRADALAAIGEIRTRLGSMAAPDLAAAVRVRVMLSAEGIETELGSTVSRELAFATHHGVHHQAMIRAIAAEFGAGTDAGFGVAPSTAHFERGAPSRGAPR